MTDEKKRQIQIGPQYQAEAPRLKKTKWVTEDDRDRCVWRSPNGIDSDETRRFYNAFTSTPHATRRMIVDHALYILMNSDYDFEKAMQQAKTPRPPAVPWTVEDQQALLSAFAMVEKNFAAIARVFPEKSTSEVVEHYYYTKKTVDYRIHRDAELQNEKYKVRPPSPNLGAIPLQDSYAYPAKLDDYTCQNCGRANVPVYDVNGLLQCLPCKNFFQVTEQQRPCRRVDVKRLCAPCPKGMDEVANKFAEMAEIVEEQPECDGDDMQVLIRHHRHHILLSTARRKAKAAKITAQLSEDKFKKESHALKARSALIHSAQAMLADLKKNARRPLITDSWSKNEETAIFHCLTTGHSHKDVAAIVGSKTESQVFDYYMHHRDAINDVLSAQHEKAVAFDKDADAAVESELASRAKNAPVEVIELE